MGNALRRRHSAFAAGLATVAMALGFTAIPAGAAPPPGDVDYVALGDSYTAGTGADIGTGMPIVPFPSPAPCIRTQGGYVDMLNAVETVELVDNEACHGALLASRAEKIVPSVLDQIALLTAQGELSADTELVTMTAGANDVRVNVVLFTCATSPVADCRQAVGSSAASMPSVGAGLLKIFAAIHRQAPNAKIGVFGYPRMFNPAGAPVIPVENQRLVNQGTALLNATIATAAATANALYRANVQYVDVTARFAGHEVNTAQPWIFLSAGRGPNDVPQFDPRSFHPNQAGHRSYADALLASVNLKQLARP